MKTLRRKNVFFVILLLLLSVSLSAGSTAWAAPSTLWTDEGVAATAFAEGEGTQEKPFIIENGAQLAYFAQMVNSGNNYAGQFFLQSGDIDLSAHLWIPIGEAWEGTRGFSGTFDGGGHKIIGMELDGAKALRTGSIGLFAFLFDGNLKNIHLVDANVRGYYASSGGRAAGLVGGVTVNGGVASEVTNCSFEGTINGGPSIGGLLGGVKVNGEGSFFMRGCKVSGTLNAKGSAGGLLGGIGVASSNGSGSVVIMDCRVDAQLYADDGNLGGITAGITLEAGKTTIDNCFVDGRLSGIEIDNMGGIAANIMSERYYGDPWGKSVLLIKGCRVDAEIAGGKKYVDRASNVGGIVGYMRTYYSKGSIENCFSTGDISGYNDIGGIIGDLQTLAGEDTNRGIVQNCFSIGNIDGGSASYVGGIVGLSTGGSHISNCYATGGVIGGLSVGGIAGSIRLESMAALFNCYALGNISGDKEVGGIIGRLDYATGTVVRNVALHDTITGTEDIGRVYGVKVYPPSDDLIVRYNYANAALRVNEATISNGTDYDKNGLDVTLVTLRTQSWWRESGAFLFGNTASAPWVWDDTLKRPVLYFADLSGEPVGGGVSTELPEGVPADVSAVAADNLKTGSEAFEDEAPVVDKVRAQSGFGETAFGSGGALQHSALVSVSGFANVKETDFTPLPVFEAKVGEAGQIAAVSLKLVGAQLFAATAGRVHVAKILSPTAQERYTFISNPADTADKTFAIQQEGSAAFLSANAAISSVGDYRVVLFIRDGGTFDLDGVVNARVLDPNVIVDPLALNPDNPDDPGGTKSGGDSSNCATLPGAFALFTLSALPFIGRPRRS